MTRFEQLPACAACGAQLRDSLVDLGLMPLANAYPTEADLDEGREKSYPLHARVCHSCFLVQVDQVASRDELFADYAYFSSYSGSWLDHARRFAKTAVDDFGLTGSSLVIEAASNDGYLLTNFADMGIPVLGIEPAANVAKIAAAKGLPTEVKFFGIELARELVSRGQSADLFVANNVLAHNPDLHAFVDAISTVLAPEGAASIEIPHLERLLADVQFDTIYHEHFFYFSLMSLEPVLNAHGIRVFDVIRLPTHGGSVRVLACHEGADTHPETAGVADVRRGEEAARLGDISTYSGFGKKVDRIRQGLVDFLAESRSKAKVVAAYGAAAKGNTLLNYCGITAEDIPYVVDRNPYKQGRLLPGSHIPIHAPAMIDQTQPDYVLIVPWNLADEISRQMAHVRDWGARLVVPVPNLKVLE